MKTNSFTARLTLRVTLLVTLTTAVVLVTGGLLLQREMIRSIELLHEGEYDELREMIGFEQVLTAEEIAARIRNDTESDAALYYTQVHRADGQVLFRSQNLGENLLPDLSGGELHWTTSLPGVGDVRVSEFHNGPWHIQIASPLAPQQRLLGEYVRVGAVLVLAVALAGIGLGYGFARVTLRPVRAIEQTARRIRGDNLGERIPVPDGDDELAALTRLLNETFERLESSFAQVTRFTADASHELKTPLALVQLNAERLRGRVAEDSEAADLVDNLLEEIGRMHRIIESLLFLSKADAGVLALELKPIDVDAWLRDFAEDARVLAEDRGVRFELRVGSEHPLRGEPNLLRQLLLNLVANALNASPSGGLVTLTASFAKGAWTFVVEDEGPGLPEQQLTRIFERFVRFERPGAEASGGHGLGLAICRGIATLHGGSLRAENRGDRAGLRMVLTLPST
jgi:signal transduction histidine kinase